MLYDPDFDRDNRINIENAISNCDKIITHTVEYKKLTTIKSFPDVQFRINIKLDTKLGDYVNSLESSTKLISISFVEMKYTNTDELIGYIGAYENRLFISLKPTF